MLGGIAVLGLVTATVASWMVEQVRVSEQEQTEDLKAEIEKLRAQLAERME